MVKWMCNTIVIDDQMSDVLRSKLGTDSISEPMRTGSLGWFGQVEIKEENDWVQHKHVKMNGIVTVC